MQVQALNLLRNLAVLKDSAEMDKLLDGMGPELTEILCDRLAHGAPEVVYEVGLGPCRTRAVGQC